MSDPTPKPKEEETVTLNLAPFAPGQKRTPAPKASPPSPSTPAPAPEDEGVTMLVARAAADVAQKGGGQGPTPTKEMLGAVAYSYAKGVYRSEDIARKMEKNPDYREAAGEKLPDAQSIRRFRRLNRQAIVETLAQFFRRKRKKNAAEAMNQTMPGAEPASPPPPAPRKPDGEPGETTLLSRKDAEDKLNQAAWIDNMSKED